MSREIVVDQRSGARERELWSTDLHKCPDNPRESLYGREFYTFKQKAVIQGYQSLLAVAPQFFMHPDDKACSEKKSYNNEPKSSNENSMWV